jgi:photosystem II stability/assembly factor-like uncharacterized protein
MKNISNSAVLTFLFFIINSVSLFPQSGWIQQVSGTNQNLTSIFFTDINNGFIVGNAGTLLKTTDGGTTWDLQSLGTTVNLKTISFLDSQNGYIFGPGKTFYKTTDAGNSWQNLSDSIKYSFQAMSFLDLQNGIAIQSTYSDTAIVYRTMDGGLSWNYLSKVPNENTYLQLLDIYYLDENTIVTAGYKAWSAVVHQSTDGGVTWSFRLQAGSSNGIAYTKTQFINSTTGFLLFNSGQSSMYRSGIYKTSNSGTSWIQLVDGTLPLCRSIYMLDENDGYAVGNDQIYLGDAKPGAIYKTSNGGTTWIQQVNNTNKTLRDVYFTDPDHGIIVGDNGAIFKTTNGGVTPDSTSWTQSSVGQQYNLRSVCLIDSLRGFCTGVNFTGKTINGGLSWSDIDNGVEYISPVDIWFTDANNGSIVGSSSHGYMFNTTNGGMDWQKYIFSGELSEMTYRIARGIYYIDNLRRIIIAQYGRILYTLDGGVTWTKCDSVTAWDLNDLSFPNAEVGYVVGDKGTILKSTDRGISWSLLQSNTNDNLYGVSFIDALNGTIVGMSGKIIRTTDGGISWSSVQSGTLGKLNKIAFDNSNGIIAGDLGIILRSSDGGFSWNQENSGTTKNLTAVSIKDSTEIIVGDYGTVLIKGKQESGNVDSSWTVHHSSTGVPLRSVSIYDNQSAIAVGNTKTGTGVAIKTMDGGVNWSQIFTTNVNLYDVDFADENIGMTVGHNTTIYKLLTTTNSGVDWTTRSYAGYYESVNLFNKNIAAAVGRDGVIMTTSNGGADWIQRNSGTTNHLSKVCLTGIKTGVAVGSNGTILTTNNSGESWTLQNSGVTDWLRDVSFSDISRGAVVGDNGTILRTTDQGITWIKQKSGTWENLNGVVFSDSVNGITVGSFGTIMITSDGGENWIKQKINSRIDFYDVSIKDSLVLCVGDSATIYRYSKWIYIDQPPDSGDLPPDSTIQIPTEYKMDQNYPNPFNSLTNINYSIPVKSTVILKVFDLLGRESATLANKEKPAGVYNVEFKNNNLSSGIYFYRLQAGSFVETKKMILLK